MGFIPILCDCNVRFQYVSIQITVTPCEQFHKIACNKTQLHSERIAQCERALSVSDMSVTLLVTSLRLIAH